MRLVSGWGMSAEWVGNGGLGGVGGKEWVLGGRTVGSPSLVSLNTLRTWFMGAYELLIKKMFIQGKWPWSLLPFLPSFLPRPRGKPPSHNYSLTLFSINKCAASVQQSLERPASQEPTYFLSSSQYNINFYLRLTAGYWALFSFRLEFADVWI